MEYFWIASLMTALSESLKSVIRTIVDIMGTRARVQVTDEIRSLIKASVQKHSAGLRYFCDGSFGACEESHTWRNLQLGSPYVDYVAETVEAL